MSEAFMFLSSSALLIVYAVSLCAELASWGQKAKTQGRRISALGGRPTMLLRTITMRAPAAAVNAWPVDRVCAMGSDLPIEAPTDREAAPTDDAALVRAARA